MFEKFVCDMQGRVVGVIAETTRAVPTIVIEHSECRYTEFLVAQAEQFSDAVSAAIHHIKYPGVPCATKEALAQAVGHIDTQNYVLPKQTVRDSRGDAATVEAMGGMVCLEFDPHVFMMNYQPDDAITLANKLLQAAEWAKAQARKPIITF